MNKQTKKLPFEIVQRLSDGEVPVTVWREHRRLSQDQLAAAAHVQVETLDAVESGKEDVPLRMMHALGGALRVDLDDLVPWTQEIDAVAVRETQVR